MRFVLFMIMTVSGDVETAQIEFTSKGQCLTAKAIIQESIAAKGGALQLHDAYCLEVRH